MVFVLQVYIDSCVATYCSQILSLTSSERYWKFLPDRISIDKLNYVPVNGPFYCTISSSSS